MPPDLRIRRPIVGFRQFRQGRTVALEVRHNSATLAVHPYPRSLLLIAHPHPQSTAACMRLTIADCHMYLPVHVLHSFCSQVHRPLH